MAWRMWSPDGAYLQGTVFPVWNTWNYSMAFINHFYWDGAGWALEPNPVIGDPASNGPCRGGAGDSVAVLFAMAGMFMTGVPTGFAGEVNRLEFQTNLADLGKHICLDTAYVPGGTWLWANAGLGHIYPDWDEQMCYKINYPGYPPVVDGPLEATFNHCDGGTLEFYGIDPEQDPIHHFEMYPDDGSIGLVERGHDAITCVWTWNSMPLSGVFEFGVRACCSEFECGMWHDVTITVTNDPPVLTPNRSAVGTQVGVEVSTFVYVDDDDCLGYPDMYISDYDGIDPANITMISDQIYWTPAPDEAGSHVVIITADDGDLQGTCEITFYTPLSADCCIPPTVGDLDQSGQMPPGSNVDGADLSFLIDMLFINLMPVQCLEEADIDFSGAPAPTTQDIDGADLSILIEYLFISLAPLPECP